MKTKRRKKAVIHNTLFDKSIKANINKYSQWLISYLWFVFYTAWDLPHDCFLNFIYKVFGITFDKFSQFFFKILLVKYYIIGREVWMSNHGFHKYKEGSEGSSHFLSSGGASVVRYVGWLVCRSVVSVVAKFCRGSVNAKSWRQTWGSIVDCTLSAVQVYTVVCTLSTVHVCWSNQGWIVSATY